MEALKQLLASLLEAVIRSFADRGDSITAAAVRNVVWQELARQRAEFVDLATGVALARLAERGDGMLARIELAELKGRRRGEETARALNPPQRFDAEGKPVDGTPPFVLAGVLDYGEALVELSRRLTCAINVPTEPGQNWEVVIAWVRPVPPRDMAYQVRFEAATLGAALEGALVEAQQRDQQEQG